MGNEYILKVSILTPSFNSGKYLERAIKSVLDQDYPNFEHIIVDGGSTDSTISILKRFPHLIWVSESDQGQSDAMNKAFKMATGDIIGYLNADDWYEAGAFNKVLQVFDEKPATQIVVGDLFIVRNNLKKRKSPVAEYSKIMFSYRYLFPNNPVSYFYRRRVQEETGEFPIDNYFSMDYWFLLEAFRKNDRNIEKINYPLGCFFFHANNKTNFVKPLGESYQVVTLHLWKHRDIFRLSWYWVDYTFYTQRIRIRMRLGAIRQNIKAFFADE